AQSETPTPGPPPPTPPAGPDLPGAAPTSPIRTMAIDAGHGGEDQGVVGPGGAKEKDLTLAVARRLKTAVETRLGIRVLLTRDDDRNIAIDERTAAANHNKADLFVSLHANASLRSGTTGASVIYAAFDKSTENAARASAGAGQV